MLCLFSGSNRTVMLCCVRQLFGNVLGQGSIRFMKLFATDVLIELWGGGGAGR